LIPGFLKIKIQPFMHKNSLTLVCKKIAILQIISGTSDQNIDHYTMEKQGQVFALQLREACKLLLWQMEIILIMPNFILLFYGKKVGEI
jgi:hypothetical protein